MAETDERMTNLFTKKATTNTSVIYLVQHLFPKNKETRTISLNSQYIVMFKNPRDVSQMTILAKHMYPGRVKFVQEAFADAISTPYGYILVDLNRTPPRIYACARPYYRTMLFSMYTCQKYKQSCALRHSLFHDVSPHECLYWYNDELRKAQSQSCPRGRTMRGRLRAFRDDSTADA